MCTSPWFGSVNTWVRFGSQRSGPISESSCYPLLIRKTKKVPKERLRLCPGKVWSQATQIKTKNSCMIYINSNGKEPFYIALHVNEQDQESTDGSAVKYIA